MLSSSLTQLKVEAAGASFVNHKAPGIEGIPTEVYKKYGEVLLPTLLKMFI